MIYQQREIEKGEKTHSIQYRRLNTVSSLVEIDRFIFTIL